MTNVWFHERGQEFLLKCGRHPDSSLQPTGWFNKTWLTKTNEIKRLSIQKDTSKRIIPFWLLDSLHKTAGLITTVNIKNDHQEYNKNEILSVIVVHTGIQQEAGGLISDICMKGNFTVLYPFSFSETLLTSAHASGSLWFYQNRGSRGEKNASTSALMKDVR